MTATLKAERDRERDNATERLRDYIRRTTILHTRTEYTRSLTDYVSVYVVRRGEIVDISYYVARATGRRLTDRGIAVRGGNFHKGLDIADSAWRARFGESLPQDKNWRHLH